MAVLIVVIILVVPMGIMALMRVRLLVQRRRRGRSGFGLVGQGGAITIQFVGHGRLPRHFR
ncbi:MAG: hypothetical protein B7Y99_11820 [Caulobacterales bacterium 32-69-10]|nr:MAG: hypothetical protein B7Y99_11820 [Caulobacterales bacterium 32-69-10]